MWVAKKVTGLCLYFSCHFLVPVCRLSKSSYNLCISSSVPNIPRSSSIHIMTEWSWYFRVNLNCDSLDKVPIFLFSERKPRNSYVWCVSTLDLLALDMIFFLIQEVTPENVTLEYVDSQGLWCYWNGQCNNS